VSKPIGFYPSLDVDTAGTGVVSHAGAVLLVETARRVGMDRALGVALSRWRAPNTVHDPGKVVCDLAIALALGGDCLADIAMVRGEPGVFGLVASDPTVSRLITTLGSDVDAVLAAINTARATARAAAWRLAGEHAPDHRISPDTPVPSIWAPPWSRRTRTSSTPRRRSNAVSGSTRCVRSSTTAGRAPGSRWRCGCAQATPARTPPLITSR
jgi:hypothetical protein